MAETMPAGLSPDARRTWRQRQASSNGVHPLALVFPGIRVHPDAPHPDGPGGNEPGPRCGSCRFRELVGHHNRAHAKCTYGAVDTVRTGYDGKPYTVTDYPRHSHSGATDVRAWWPACTDHTPTSEAP
jgi:hypothetical protein